MSGTSSAAMSASESGSVSSGAELSSGASSGTISSGSSVNSGGSVTSSGTASSTASTDPAVGSGLSGFVYMPRSPIGDIAAWTIIRNGAVIEKMTASGQIGQCTRFSASTFATSGGN